MWIRIGKMYIFKEEENCLNDYPLHIDAIRRALLQSEVFIFTVAANECWQLRDGTVISRNPRSGFNHLVSHKVLSVQENIDNMVQFFEEVKRRNPKFTLILTLSPITYHLSPIPFAATGRSDTHHVIEANAHSKAVLRVAIDEVVSKYEDVYYLPSYELVTECCRDPWMDDDRHVTKETIAKVMNMFKAMFVR
jgi:hypothetical protein